MSQKNLVILTLAVVVAGAVFVNEMIVRKVDQDRNRDVANTAERFQPEQIKWEQEHAKAVSQVVNGQTQIGAKPSLSEKFLYEALEGRYEAQVVNGKILKITLMTNREAIPLNTDEVLKKYADVFKGAKTYSRQTASENNLESLNLKGDNSQDVGLVRIQRDNQGRVLTIEIQ